MSTPRVYLTVTDADGVKTEQEIDPATWSLTLEEGDLDKVFGLTATATNEPGPPKGHRYEGSVTVPAPANLQAWLDAAPVLTGPEWMCGPPLLMRALGWLPPLQGRMASTQSRRALRTGATKRQRRDRRRHAALVARLTSVLGPLAPIETWRGPAYKATAPNGAYATVRISEYAGHADVALWGVGGESGPQHFVDHDEDLDELRALWASARGCP